MLKKILVVRTEKGKKVIEPAPEGATPLSIRMISGYVWCTDDAKGWDEK